jgi:hypothetical protein
MSVSGLPVKTSMTSLPSDCLDHVQPKNGIRLSLMPFMVFKKEVVLAVITPPER